MRLAARGRLVENDSFILLPNVRFWFLVQRVNRPRSFVKIAIRPGQRIEHRERGTDAKMQNAFGFRLTYSEDCDGMLTLELFKYDTDGRISHLEGFEADIINCTDDGQPIWCAPSYRLYD